MNFKDLEKGDVFNYFGNHYLRIKEDFEGNNAVDLDADCSLCCFGGEYKVEKFNNLYDMMVPN